MTPSDLLTEGISLMLFGMGFVFLFLTALVIVTSVMSRIINRYFEDPLTASPAHVIGSTQNSANDEELVAVIGAAIRMHRNRHAGNKEP